MCMIDLKSKEDKYLSSRILYRGDFTTKEVNKACESRWFRDGSYYNMELVEEHRKSMKSWLPGI